ncbi:MAG: DEAD/DEAH box helicase [Dehalococcoidia bacterium]|nr:DEAD/DEAH box helicase [Dehalococcoidia bacterium]
MRLLKSPQLFLGLIQMDAAAFLHHLVSLADYGQQIAHIERIPHQGTIFGKLDKPLHPSLQTCLESVGISALFSHQTEALNAIFAGRNVIIATPSASGKTLCYHLATLHALVHDKNSRALYIFPTKALAQDQLRSLKQIAEPLSLRSRSEAISLQAMATFDGDTPQVERANIRKQARVVLTNPDMLHLGILPNHQSWAKLFRNLKYVVVDETHIYRGVFGSHVANILRRLRRLCSFYGSAPQFICCSATIANPREHAQNIVGLPFEAVVEDGSPHGEKYFTFWNPPLIDEAKTGRRSSNSEAAFLLGELVQKEIRSLVFASTRKLTELIYIYTQEQLPPSLKDKISPYRAGYLPEDRRRIEHQFFEGELLGLVATTALELGINIGDLDATVLTGYPGSIASAWQQAGRSGRSTHSSLSFLIALENPLDQYLMRNPEFFFSKNFDNAIINPDNPYILKPHLLCAAWEKPLEDKDEAFFGANMDNMLAELEQEERLRKLRERWHPAPCISYPAQDMNIRSTSGQNYAVIDGRDGCLLETVEASVAFFQVHPGAIYLHQGESYLIKELDLARRIAWAEPKPVDYYTQTMEIHEIRVKKLLQENNCRSAKVYFGDVDVTITVVGFKRYKQFTEEVVEAVPLDLPPQTFPTKALWFDLPQKAIDKIADAGLDFHGGLHACEHAAIGILPLFALCDRNDIGGVSTPVHPDTGKPQIFIYDAHSGGIGIAEKGFEMITELWHATLKAVAECPCADGCPSCVQSPKCGNNNEPLDKEAAIVLLEELAA